ncbi:DUF3087 domain-containing protein [Maricurvus nonylphenolicus]|uniref:DUF3087 family protein n=1 Tax=Maricurvus nonylphenolicus TaxID=1008307 RepID=UPI0036F1C313
MTLQSIDKSLYQQRYKRVAIGLAVSLAVLSLSISTLLITLFGSSESGSNTGLNVIGVAVSVAILVFALQKLKHKPYFKEVAYVWALKQELNHINRHIHKIKAAAQEGDANAMIVLNFSYQGSEQLWQLDDNTLVMDELRVWKADLEELKQRYSVETSLEDYRRELLQNF